MALFGRPRYSTVKVKKREIPDGVFTKCKNCQQMITNKELEAALMVCTKCKFHYPLSARKRLVQLLDEGSFEEMDVHIRPTDPLRFVDTKSYELRLKTAGSKDDITEAVVTGTGAIDGMRVAIGTMDFSYMGGSMGSVVGEKIARLIERTVAERIPLVIISSSGGARMQESTLSLMQMAKTSGALHRLDRSGLLFISVLTHPTTGGTTASFASLGDIHVAEPGALIGFAGPRVIKQTIKQDLPEGFQTSEFLLEHGFIDIIVERKGLQKTLSYLIRFFEIRTGFEDTDRLRSPSAVRNGHIQEGGFGLLEKKSGYKQRILNMLSTDFS